MRHWVAVNNIDVLLLCLHARRSPRPDRFRGPLNPLIKPVTVRCFLWGAKLFQKQFAPEQIVLSRRNTEKLPRICILSVFLFLFRDQSHMVCGTCTKVIYLHWKGPLWNERSWTVVRSTRALNISLSSFSVTDTQTEFLRLFFPLRIALWNERSWLKWCWTERDCGGDSFLCRGLALFSRPYDSHSIFARGLNSSAKLSFSTATEQVDCRGLFTPTFRLFRAVCEILQKTFPPFNVLLLKLPAKERIIRGRFLEGSNEIECLN